MIAATDAVHAVHPRPAHHSVVSWPDDPAANISSNMFFANKVNDDEPGQPGQFIYYMPLGHEGGKGENPRAWTRGFGDRFNTFWCCYGTAVESFSKLSDSIYFWYQPPSTSVSTNSTTEFMSSNSSSNSSGTSSFKSGTAGTAGSDDGESTNGSKSSTKSQIESEVYPILFVNQFVSSTLRWKVKEKSVVIKQTADLYSSNVATSRVVISVPISRTGIRTRTDVNSTRESGSSVNFYLYWRRPSWLKSEVEEEEDSVTKTSSSTSSNSTAKMKLIVRINEKTLDLRTSPRVVHGTHVQTALIKKKQEKQPQGAPSSIPVWSTPAPLQLALGSTSSRSRGFSNPPTFGKDSSDYIILGPEWNDNDVIEIEMPMKITVEELNDSRPEKQNLKAIMMGPFQMAGLTENNDREIDIDPKYIENAVTMLENNKINEEGYFGDQGTGARRDDDDDDGAQKSYPKGARLLSGRTKKYVIAPIGQLIDEKYTAYFQFIEPSGVVASE